MEDFGNYQQSGIISGLDNETISALKQVQKNFNDEFMNGSSTSGFRQYKESGNKSYLASSGENLSGVLNGINNAQQLIDSVITPKLISYVTAYVSNVVMSYMSNAITDMLSFDAGAIPTKAAEIMQEYIIGPGQIMQELLKTRESMNDELMQETQMQMINKINDKIGEGVGKVTDEINKIMDDINPTIAEISYYSQMGPVWVQSKLDLATQKIVENALSGIGQARDKLNKIKEDAIENMAEQKGKDLANKANDKIKKGLKDKLDEVNKQKQDAMNKVKTQITNVKLKLFALIGA